MIFVFGSNLAGRHGKGAALTARLEHGAQYGVSNGFTGNAYAIPTCNGRLQPLPLGSIKRWVDRFLDDAQFIYPTLFKVTRIGCGLAYYTDQDIAPMFESAPDNCLFDEKWRPFLGDTSPTGTGRGYWGTY